jgi:hypothetical protein
VISEFAMDANGWVNLDILGKNIVTLEFLA